MIELKDNDFVMTPHFVNFFNCGHTLYIKIQIIFSVLF